MNVNIFRHEFRTRLKSVIVWSLALTMLILFFTSMFPLFSGQAATADLLEKARALGHEFEILAKPVHPTDLLAKLRS